MIDNLFAKRLETEQEALELLVTDDSTKCPNLSYEDALKYDFYGKDLWREGKFRGLKQETKEEWTRRWNGKKSMEKASYCRIVAARNFEREAKNIEKNGNIKISRVLVKMFEILKEAAFSYDGAAKNVYDLGFKEASVKCRGKSLEIYRILYEQTRNREYLREIKNAERFIEDIKKGHNPFYYQKIKMAKKRGVG